MKHRVFLDANVLFSASWSPNNGLLALWEKTGIHLCSSHYAADEAERNLESSEQIERLKNLLKSVTMADPCISESLPDEASGLEEKDQPILLAAMAANADILLTGDRAHFGRWYGKTLGGVRILRPADFLRE